MASRVYDEDVGSRQEGDDVMRKPSVPRILLHRAFPMEEVKVENITLNPMHEIRLYLNGDIEQYLFGQLVQEDNIGKEITDKDLEIWFAKKKKK